MVHLTDRVVAIDWVAQYTFAVSTRDCVHYTFSVHCKHTQTCAVGALTRSDALAMFDIARAAARVDCGALLARC